MGNIAAAITSHPSSSSPTTHPPPHQPSSLLLTDHLSQLTNHPPHQPPSSTLQPHLTINHPLHQPSLPSSTFTTNNQTPSSHQQPPTSLTPSPLPSLSFSFFHILPLCLGNSVNKNKAAFFSERTQSWRVIETQVCSVALIRTSCATLGSLLHFSDLNVPSVNEGDNASSQIRTLYGKGLIGTSAYYSQGPYVCFPYLVFHK